MESPCHYLSDLEKFPWLCGPKNFAGCGRRKSWTEEYIKKKQHSRTAEIKSPSFLGAFYFFFSPKSRTRSSCIMMLHSDASWFPFECKQNALDWDLKIDSEIPPPSFFFISSVYYLKHDRHQPRLTVDWAVSQYTQDDKTTPKARGGELTGYLQTNIQSVAIVKDWNWRK